MNNYNYFDTDAISNVNGWKHIKRSSIVELYHQLYNALSANGFELSVNEYKYLHHIICTKIYYAVSFVSSKELSEMVLLLFETCFNNIYKDNTHEKILMLPRTSEEMKLIPLTDVMKNKYKTLYSVNSDIDTLHNNIDDNYIKTWKRIATINFESLHRHFGLTKENIENYNINDWYKLEYSIREQNKNNKNKNSRNKITLNIYGESTIPNEVGRPSNENVIQKIDKKTNEIVKTYSNRQQCIEDNNIPKSTLSRILNPNDKLKAYKGYKYVEIQKV